MRHPDRTRLRAPGLTLTELLVVVIIIALLATVAIPSFQAMIRGTEETLAESQLSTAMRQARDVALRAGAGNDSAAVFFFTEEGRYQIIPYVRTATITDLGFTDGAGSPQPVERDIFVPAPGLAPIQLPKGWGVRGYAAPLRVEQYTPEGWFSSVNVGTTQRYDERIGNWVFPETTVHNAGARRSGPARNTFIVRFEGGTGEVLSGNADAVLLLSPGMSSEAVATLGAQVATALVQSRYLISEDPARYVQTVLRGRSAVGGFSAGQQLNVLGRISSDMILARPVTQIALANERTIARALGARLSDSYPALIERESIASTDASGGARFIDNADARMINSWIDGDTNGNGRYGDPDDSFEAKIFVFDRYTGAPRRADVQPEVTP